MIVFDGSALMSLIFFGMLACWQPAMAAITNKTLANKPTKSKLLFFISFHLF
jgi:hypothetical protein